MPQTETATATATETETETHILRPCFISFVFISCLKRCQKKTETRPGARVTNYEPENWLSCTRLSQVSMWRVIAPFDAVRLSRHELYEFMATHSAFDCLPASPPYPATKSHRHTYVLKGVSSKEIKGVRVAETNQKLYFLWQIIIYIFFSGGLKSILRYWFYGQELMELERP